MGEVIDFTSGVERCPENLQKVEPYRVHTVEELSLLRLLRQQGINVLDEKSSTDFDLVMCMIKGMRDRQCGEITSENCLYLETLGMAMRQAKEVPKDDGEFDDLLSKL